MSTKTSLKLTRSGGEVSKVGKKKSVPVEGFTVGHGRRSAGIGGGLGHWGGKQRKLQKKMNGRGSTKKKKKKNADSRSAPKSQGGKRKKIWASPESKRLGPQNATGEVDTQKESEQGGMGTEWKNRISFKKRNHRSPENPFFGLRGVGPKGVAVGDKGQPQRKRLTKRKRPIPIGGLFGGDKGGAKWSL